MRNVVRAIIIDDNSLLTLKRVKNDSTYWVFPGGGIEDGETHVDALVRECREELGLDVEVLNPTFEKIFINKRFCEQVEYFYSCRIIGGQLGTGNGPEYSQNSHYEGTYEPCWIGLSDVPILDLRPLEMKNNLVGEYFETGIFANREACLLRE